MSKQVIQPPEMALPHGVWSPVIVSQPGRMAFLAGYTSRDAKGEVFGLGDIKAQTRRVCELLQIGVRAAGGELKDIVRVDVYVRNIKHFKEIHEVRKEFFPTDPPVSTMVEVTSLVDERLLIEINAIAMLP